MEFIIFKNLTFEVLKIMKKNIIISLISITSFMVCFSQQTELMRSGDAFVSYDNISQSWTLGTKLITQVLQLEDGKFLLKKLKNNFTGTDYIGTAVSDEFRFVFDEKLFTGSRGEYKLISYHVSKIINPRTAPEINPGICLEIVLKNDLFSIKFHYEVFASSDNTSMGMVKKYYVVTNISSTPKVLTEISMHQMEIDWLVATKLRLHYWQGGGSMKNTNQEFVDSLVNASHTFHSDAGANDYRADDNFSGSSSYHPYFVMQHDANEGLFLGFNYLGPWSMKIWSDYIFASEKEFKDWALFYKRYFYINSQIDQHRQTLNPNESFEVPNCFIGVYKGDLDNANEQLQYLQAAYKWDYTREKYLFGGNIYNAAWNDTAAMYKTTLHFQQLFQMVNIARTLGFTIVHEDDFWFDKRGRGVWEGVDWKPIVDYADKSGINFKLWMPPYHFAPNTPNDLNQKDWHLDPKTSPGITSWYGYGYCMGSDQVVEYLKNFLLDRQKRYGTYINRFDGWVEAPCYSDKHNHEPGQSFVAQYRNTIRLLKEVKDANQYMGIEGCNSGGEWANWDKEEYLESQQGSDGGGEDDFYHLSYFWCVPKMILAGASSTITKEQIPQTRNSMLMLKYLRKQKVVDRYMNLYHPKAINAATSHCFIERTNADRNKCVISQNASSRKDVTVFPKALNPEVLYSVKFRLNNQNYIKTGHELMQQGISFKDTSASEIIFLNLDDFPGSKTDHTPPTKPIIKTVQKDNYCGHEGTSITWRESTDDRLLAGYEIYRDGMQIDFVAIGTFYFDFSKGNNAKARYKIVAVDGDGNKSK